VGALGLFKRSILAHIPIRQTALYEQGVGLGASKAKEVTNFQGYREMARDSVSPHLDSLE
jgi:hypothetical protein